MCRCGKKLLKRLAGVRLRLQLDVVLDAHLVDEIELQLQGRSGREVSSNEIGELVLQQLGEISEVAYVRFASVYRQFQGISDFVATLEGLSRRPRSRAAKLATAVG